MYLLELAGEDDRFALREAATAAAGVEPLAAGLATARGVAGVERLALTHRVSRLVGVADGTPADARRLLAAADPPAGAADGDATATVAVRARDVRTTTGVDTRAVERELGAALVDRGFAVDLEDPDHELRVLFARPDAWRDPGADETGAADADAVGDADPAYGRGPRPETDRETVVAVGWLATEVPRSFAPQPTERPFFQPGSMDPQLARALANLAGAGPGRRIVDPMCGTAGLLIEAGLVGSEVVGVDARERMARGAARNLRAYVGGETLVGDATRLPLADDAADGVLFDAPYGRQSVVRGDDLRSLVREALREARRVAPRGVVVGDRSWVDAAREAGWRVDTVLRRRVHRSLVRHVAVLAAEGPDATPVDGDLGAAGRR